MQESQTEREKELELKLAERDQSLASERQRNRKLKIGFFSVSSFLGCLLLLHCAPVRIGSGSASATATAVAATICTGTSILGVAGSALCAVTGTSTVVSIVTLLQSNANRDGVIRPTQLTQGQEVTTYGA